MVLEKARYLFKQPWPVTATFGSPLLRDERLEFPWCLGIMVKHLPAVQETQVQFWGKKIPLEKGMTTHSTVASRFPWMEETGRESDMTE